MRARGAGERSKVNSKQARRVVVDEKIDSKDLGQGGKVASRKPRFIRQETRGQVSEEAH